MFSRLLAGLKRSRKDAEVFFGLVDRPGWGGQRTGKINIPQQKNQLHMILEILLGHGIYSSFPFWMSFGMGQKRMNKQIGGPWLIKDKM